MSQIPPKTVIGYSWFIIKKYKWLFFISGITLSFFRLGNGFVFPWLVSAMTGAIENYSGNKELFIPEVGKYFIYILVAHISSELLVWAGILGRKYYIPRMKVDSDNFLFSYIQKHSQQYFSSEMSGKLASKITDISGSMRNFNQVLFWTLLPLVVLIPVNLFTFFQISSIVATLTTIWIVFHIGLVCSQIKKWNTVNKDHAEIRSKSSGAIVDTISNFSIVKLFSGRIFEQNRLAQLQKKERLAHVRAWNTVNNMMWKLDVVYLALYGGILFFLGYGFMNGTLKASEIIFIFMAKEAIARVVWDFTWTIPDFVSSVGTMDAALKTLLKPRTVQDIEGAKPLQITAGKIQTKSLGFKYKKEYVFKNLNLSINAGEKIGLVGLSGAGKSTLVNLMLRLYDLDKGSIEIDGQDISKVQQETLRKQIAMVSQDNSLFHRTLAENIKYGKPNATQKEVEKAAKLAHAHDFILTLDKKYQSKVGERGIKLSGGQRQRIAIARAFLKDAPILILDEATSALDTETEKVIQESLTTLMRGRTTIAIAHRLSTLLEMDRIIVLDKGQIKEQGSHTDLLKKKGLYAKLWKMQSGGFLPE
ncbi:MAG: ABC transporter ATP-binding protein [Alphaproteobacteria bacterium]|nr:ABC transporter ATP-binding protein [Alphaproteobacteria bacterium]